MIGLGYCFGLMVTVVGLGFVSAFRTEGFDCFGG